MTSLEMLSKENFKVLSKTTDDDIVTLECERMFGAATELTEIGILASQGYMLISFQAHLEHKYTMKLRKPS